MPDKAITIGKAQALANAGTERPLETAKRCIFLANFSLLVILSKNRPQPRLFLPAYKNKFNIYKNMFRQQYKKYFVRNIYKF